MVGGHRRGWNGRKDRRPIRIYRCLGYSLLNTHGAARVDDTKTTCVSHHNDGVITERYPDGPSARSIAWHGKGMGMGMGHGSGNRAVKTASRSSCIASDRRSLQRRINMTI